MKGKFSHPPVLTHTYIYDCHSQKNMSFPMKEPKVLLEFFWGFAYQGKDVVFRFIIECNSSLRDFGP
jgi:hypothetical protein